MKIGLHDLVISNFINDIKIMSPKESGITQQVKTELTVAFLMVDIGPISFYPGRKVERNREKQTIKLSQPTYINKILSRFYLDKASTTTTSMKKINNPTALHRMPSYCRWKWEILRHDWLHNVLNGRDEASYSICYLSCSTVCKKPWPLTH